MSEKHAPHGYWVVGIALDSNGRSVDAIMRPHPLGDYVQADDYSTMWAERDAIAAEREVLKARVRELEALQGAT